MFDLDAANINGVMPENIVDIYIAYTLCIKIMMPYLMPCYFEYDQKRHLYLPSGPGMLTEAPPLSKSCAVETIPKRIDSCKGDSIL